jgi:hypothetical protein
MVDCRVFGVHMYRPRRLCRLCVRGLGLSRQVRESIPKNPVGTYCIAGGFRLAAAEEVLYALDYPLARLVHLYHGYQLVGVVSYVMRALAVLWVANAT